jgi:hypothetical protein
VKPDQHQHSLYVVTSSEMQLRALEAVRHVADDYGLAAASVKPCVAFLLDGNIGGAGRHEAAFTIAIDCRRMGLNEAETGHVLMGWAKKIGYSLHEARRATRSAYQKTADGKHWRYYPPGVNKRPGSRYERVLGDICSDVGCPANCAPFMNLQRGPRGQDLARFEQLGWPLVLRKQRRAAAVDYYRAICLLERQRGFAAGAILLTSWGQLAELAGHNRRHAGENLRVLFSRGLLSVYEPGSGSGPNARDRRPSQVARAIPIPGIAARYRTAITTGGDSPLGIEAASTPEIGGASPPHIERR